MQYQKCRQSAPLMEPGMVVVMRQLDMYYCVVVVVSSMRVMMLSALYLVCTNKLPGNLCRRIGEPTVSPRYTTSSSLLRWRSGDIATCKLFWTRAATAVPLQRNLRSYWWRLIAVILLIITGLSCFSTREILSSLALINFIIFKCVNICICIPTISSVSRGQSYVVHDVGRVDERSRCKRAVVISMLL